MVNRVSPSSWRPAEVNCVASRCPTLRALVFFDPGLLGALSEAGATLDPTEMELVLTLRDMLAQVREHGRLIHKRRSDLHDPRLLESAQRSPCTDTAALWATAEQCWEPPVLSAACAAIQRRATDATAACFVSKVVSRMDRDEPTLVDRNRAASVLSSPGEEPRTTAPKPLVETRGEQPGHAVAVEDFGAAAFEDHVVERAFAAFFEAGALHLIAGDPGSAAVLFRRAVLTAEAATEGTAGPAPRGAAARARAEQAWPLSLATARHFLGMALADLQLATEAAAWFMQALRTVAFTAPAPAQGGVVAGSGPVPHSVTTGAVLPGLSRFPAGADLRRPVALGIASSDCAARLALARLTVGVFEAPAGAWLDAAAVGHSGTVLEAVEEAAAARPTEEPLVRTLGVPEVAVDLPLLLLQPYGWLLACFDPDPDAPEPFARRDLLPRVVDHVAAFLGPATAAAMEAMEGTSPEFTLDPAQWERARDACSWARTVGALLMATAELGRRNRRAAFRALRDARLLDGPDRYARAPPQGRHTQLGGVAHRPSGPRRSVPGPEGEVAPSPVDPALAPWVAALQEGLDLTDEARGEASVADDALLASCLRSALLAARGALLFGRSARPEAVLVGARTVELDAVRHDVSVVTSGDVVRRRKGTRAVDAHSTPLMPNVDRLLTCDVSLRRIVLPTGARGLRERGPNVPERPLFYTCQQCGAACADGLQGAVADMVCVHRLCGNPGVVVGATVALTLSTLRPPPDAADAEHGPGSEEEFVVGAVVRSLAPHGALMARLRPPTGLDRAEGTPPRPGEDTVTEALLTAAHDKGWLVDVAWLAQLRAPPKDSAAPHCHRLVPVPRPAPAAGSPQRAVRMIAARPGPDDAPAGVVCYHCRDYIAPGRAQWACTSCAFTCHARCAPLVPGAAVVDPLDKDLRRDAHGASLARVYQNRRRQSSLALTGDPTAVDGELSAAEHAGQLSKAPRPMSPTDRTQRLVDAKGPLPERLTGYPRNEADARLVFAHYAEEGDHPERISASDFVAICQALDRGSGLCDAEQALQRCKAKYRRFHCVTGGDDVDEEIDFPMFFLLLSAIDKE